MLFQQELWLIIVGLVVAFVLRRTLFFGGSFIRIASWACIFSLIACGSRKSAQLLQIGAHDARLLT